MGVIFGDKGHTMGLPYPVYVPEHEAFKHCWTFSRGVLVLAVPHSYSHIFREPP
jgi:hypothetical protein